MPKTRRAGRKNQLRRITAQYHKLFSNNDNALLGVDYVKDSEYENIFRQANPSLGSNKDNYSQFLGTEYKDDPEYEKYFDKNSNCIDNKPIELLPWNLEPITFIHRKLPSLTIPEEDPRRIPYLQKRNDITRNIMLKVSEIKISRTGIITTNERPLE